MSTGTVKYPQSMCKSKAKAKQQILDSYTIKGTRDPIKRGDCVLIKPSKPKENSYVARVDEIFCNSKRDNVEVDVTWYYRPEDTRYGRLVFQGKSEVILSNHKDIESVHTIEGKCTVHSEHDYSKLTDAGDDDFFCRTKHCTCALPCNPDYPMIQCDGCETWFHPRCVGIMTRAELKNMDRFFCKKCLD